MFSSLNSLLPSLKKISAKEFFVVTSYGKSGSTWVQKILDAHPDIYCGGEGKFQSLLAGLMPAIDRYNANLNQANRYIYSDSPYYHLWQPDQINALIHFAMTLTLLSSSRPLSPQIKLIGDKDTGYLLNYPVWKDTLLPGTKFVHVIRDVRNAAISNYFHLKRQGDPMVIGDPQYYDFLHRFVRDWKQAITRARSLSPIDSPTYHEIFYEHLYRQPAAETKRLFTFLGLSASARQIQACLRQASFVRLSQGRSPGQEDPNSFYRKGVIGDWRRHFDAKSKTIVHQTAAGLLHQLGYDLD